MLFRSLSPYELKQLYNNDEVPTKLKKYGKISFDIDTSTGSFDEEKGAMYNFEMYVWINDALWMGEGGYYTNHGVVFNSSVTFVKEKEKEPKIIKCPHCGKDIEIE